MRVLIATGIYPPEVGGPATYSKLLEERLPALGIDVTVLPFSRVRHLPKVIRHVAYFWKCVTLARSVDLVYAQDTVSVGLPAALAATLAHKKFILRVPGDYAWEQGQFRFGVTDDLEAFQTQHYDWKIEVLRRIQKLVANRALAIVVPSNYMKILVSNWTNVKKIRTIYSSVEMIEPQPVTRPEGFLIVSAGRRVPWKGFDALERVANRDASWKLFIASDLPRAEMLGWVTAANVFVLNSTYEGLSHTLVEAMMLGTPIIATNVGGNPELIIQNETGLLIPPKDDEALFGAIKEVANDPAAAQARAVKAKERAKQFSIDYTIGQVAELIKTV